jgi:SEC-C motif-containing protein
VLSGIESGEHFVTSAHVTTPASSPASLPSSAPCPCGSGRTFGECCEPILKQQKPAATAEQLMRSRFTAHFLRDHQHLHRTYLPTARQPYVEEKEAIELNWKRLVIHAHEPGPKPDVATVDFSAYYDDNGVEQAMHEKSEFRQIDGQWFFVRPLRSGPAPVRSAQAKVGRNDPCPCGSGKKYKHCCGK